MAKECSFDIASKVDLQEVDNAVHQTLHESASASISRAARSASSGRSMPSP